MIIQIKNLHKSYRNKQVLNNISFEVKENQIIAILGPNGVGKTTLLEVLMTLKNWDSGEISIHGLDLKKKSNLAKIRSNIGVVFQEGGMYAYLKIVEILDLFASFHNVAKERIEEIIKIFSLESHLHVKYEKLSGGWKKRTLLACAFLNNPKVLFLDEPTTGLDPEATDDLWKTIKKAKDQGVTVLLSTHSLEEVDMYADYALILKDSAIAEQGKPKELKKKYNALYFKEVYFKIINKEDTEDEQIAHQAE
ncbi:ABC transporter ATP-binding protein [Bacillaceae bacterium Marseille-Q3522]|nr:ABC transporter ATP-binding protein [Bacillaceae bacterium Marseille-Q3522]